RLCRRAARGGEADPRRSQDFLFEPRRGLERLSAREAVAAAEPGAGARPARTRPGARGAQSRPVGDGDAIVARAFRRRGRGARGRTQAKGPFRRYDRLRRGLSDDGRAGRDRPVQTGPRAPVALCGDRVQHVRPQQRIAPHGEWISSQCKREALTDGGIGAMIHAGANAGEVTRQEGELLVRSLLSAGFDTTVHGLGAAIRQLALNPGEYAALRDDPAKARAAFEEALRLETPV